MVTVSLLRHAKSSWADRATEDLDRPLAPRGIQAAPAMGLYMRETGVTPNLVICSPARRTRQTLELILPYLAPLPSVLYEDDLYPAAPEDILKRLRDVPEPHDHVLVVAHNPGLQTVARELAASGEPELVAALGDKFPTCALAVLTFADGWSAVEPGRGTLANFVTPKRLSKSVA